MTRTLGVVALLILPGAWGVHAPFDRDEARLCTLVVPLGHGPSCVHRPLTRREWVAPGDTVTFLLDLENTGPDGEPIFLQWTHRGPHPGAGEARYSLSRGKCRELTGPQLFEFLHAIPFRDRTRTDPASAVADFRSWVVENADSTAYPVAETLRGLARSREPGG